MSCSFPHEIGHANTKWKATLSTYREPDPRRHLGERVRENVDSLFQGRHCKTHESCGHEDSLMIRFGSIKTSPSEHKIRSGGARDAYPRSHWPRTRLKRP